MHSVSIHKHWPLAQIARIRKRFSDSGEAVVAIETFKNRYLASTGVQITEQQMAVPSYPKTPTSWLVLPFVFGLSTKKIQSSVSKVRVPDVVSHLVSSVRISWCLGNKHLMHLVRRPANAKHLSVDEV